MTEKRKRKKGYRGEDSKGIRTDVIHIRYDDFSLCAESKFQRFSDMLHIFLAFDLTGYSSREKQQPDCKQPSSQFSCCSSVNAVQQSVCPTSLCRHLLQQSTNKVITSTSQLIKQLSDIISSSSWVRSASTLLWLTVLTYLTHITVVVSTLKLVLQQDRLHLSRLKTELSESVQRYGDLQKVAHNIDSFPPFVLKDGACD